MSRPDGGYHEAVCEHCMGAIVRREFTDGALGPWWHANTTYVSCAPTSGTDRNVAEPRVAS